MGDNSAQQQTTSFLQPGLAGFPGQQGGHGQQQQGQSNMWNTTFDTSLPDGQSPDSWSTGSAQGAPVPSTLNVEDW